MVFQLPKAGITFLLLGFRTSVGATQYVLTLMSDTSSQPMFWGSLGLAFQFFFVALSMLVHAVDSE
jgi:hypothetical protein